MALLTQTQRMRKARLNMVLNMVKTMERIDYKKLLGLLAMNYGFKTDTSRSYVRELRDAEYIQVKDGVIMLSDSFIENQQKEIENAKKELEEREDAIT